ncbi:hypothetical protein [Aromatoleum evansii]|uniref:hypothetical protein n=1 Tax=Aromatoleum evansii TaxID=59406 RepID=UPI001FE38AED|nr:hypothetical protein [Aromatoleum evansii]
MFALGFLQQCRSRELAGQPLQLVRFVEQAALRQRLLQGWRQRRCGVVCWWRGDDGLPRREGRGLRRGLSGEQESDQPPGSAECRARAFIAREHRIGKLGENRLGRALGDDQFERVAGSRGVVEGQRVIAPADDGLEGAVGQFAVDRRDEALAGQKFGKARLNLAYARRAVDWRLAVEEARLGDQTQAGSEVGRNHRVRSCVI